MEVLDGAFAVVHVAGTFAAAVVDASAFGAAAAVDVDGACGVVAVVGRLEGVPGRDAR